MIAGDLALQQGFAVDPPLRIFGANAGFLGIGNARRHGASRGEDDGQVAEGQRAHEQAGHDLVTDAETDRRVEGVMGQGHGGGHGDDVAAEQRQVHAGATLGDAVAHGGHAAGDLGGGIHLAHGVADDLREAFERLMGRQHVVEGGDHADIGLDPRHGIELVLDRGAGEGVGPVGAAELGPADAG